MCCMNNSEINFAMQYAERRSFLGRNMPSCPECRSQQVQLTGYINVWPAEWKCRHCKHRFIFEPFKEKETMIEKDIRKLNGEPTTHQDPERGLWYGARCTFWTDDWNRVTGVGPGIPCCPHCGSPGMQITAKDWFDGAARFQREGNTGYVIFLAQSRETCHRGKGFLAWYKEWLIENPNGREANPRAGN